MIVGQDWASEAMLSGDISLDRVRFGYDPERHTNLNLQYLLREHFGLEFTDVYATNAFPFVKPGVANSHVKAVWMRDGVENFLLPQIAIVRPRVVICLGRKVIDAVRHVLGYPLLPFADVIAADPIEYETAKVFAAAHTSPQGINNRNRQGEEQVSRDWARMAKAAGKNGSRRGGSYRDDRR